MSKLLNPHAHALAILENARDQILWAYTHGGGTTSGIGVSPYTGHGAYVCIISAHFYLRCQKIKEEMG